MRADDNGAARAEGKRKLLAFLETHRKGTRIPINSWYRFVRELGLEHSHRQRLSEIRDAGYSIDFDRTEKCYVWGGYLNPGQLSLLEVNG